MESIATFTAKYSREHREEQTEKLKAMYGLTDDEAAAMYERNLKDVVEAAIVSNEVDPDLD